MRSLKRLIYAGDSIWRFISHDFWIPCSSNHTCPFPLWLIPLRTAMSCSLFSQSRLRLLKMGLFWWMLRYVGNTDVRPGVSRRHVRHGCRLPHVSNRILIRDHRMTWSKRLCLCKLFQLQTRFAVQLTGGTFQHNIEMFAYQLCGSIK